MIIPTQFQLGGIKWKVRQNKTLKEYNVNGRNVRDKALIELDVELMPQHKELTMCHELVHSILYSMGDAGPHDEKFVDGFAYFLHQYLQTAK